MTSLWDPVLFRLSGDSPNSALLLVHFHKRLASLHGPEGAAIALGIQTRMAPGLCSLETRGCESRGGGRGAECYDSVVCHVLWEHGRHEVFLQR